MKCPECGIHAEDVTTDEEQAVIDAAVAYHDAYHSTPLTQAHFRRFEDAVAAYKKATEPSKEQQFRKLAEDIAEDPACVAWSSADIAVAAARGAGLL